MPQITGLGHPFASSDALFLPKTFGVGQTNAAAGSEFSKMMLNQIQEVAALEHRAQAGISDNLGGGDITLAENVIAMREADLAMKLMLQVQRKLVEAWKELKNMQV